jgi:hypothetical protein
VNGFRESLIVSAATVLSCSGATLARAQDVSDVQDLTAVIALNGKPCGKVVSAAKRGENDYVATCEDGNRYRVRVENGRVVVEKAN